MPAVASLHDLPFSAMQAMLERAGVHPIHAKPLWASLYRPESARALFPPPLERWAATAIPATYALENPAVAADIRSSDGLTRKFLLRLHDGQEIETVLMGYAGRHTACLSTQAGCAMGCTFCATGQMGFSRHLRPGEIVAQVLQCREALNEQNAGAAEVAGADGRDGESSPASPPASLRNLVLMGMGEPLHNYDAVMTALDIITDRRGINIGPGRITISTVGVVPGILRLAEESRPYNLAVSLHGSSEEERSALVPASRRWPLAMLIDACRTYTVKTKRRIFFEWTLIAGANDSPAQAARLAALLEGIDSHVNLIPLNPTHGFAGAEAPAEAALRFQQVLQKAGIPSTLRQRRGIDVAAGCGMLKAEKRKR